ncbi:MAG: hypothetical protein WC780_17425 [Lentimicrobiaceae bacterium]|jgi:hypothetical protein
MKKSLFTTLFSLLCLGTGILLSGSDPVTYGDYLPVYMDRSEMEQAVKIETAQPLRTTGKIYLYGQYILVNEKYKGIHVIDNSNPEAPQNVAFLHIDGCIDMAMKNNVLYADNAIDLIALKTTDNFSTIQVTERIKGIFPETESPDGYWSIYTVNQFRPKNGILVAWKKKN